MASVVTKSRLWQLFLVLLPIPLTALITLWVTTRSDNIIYLDYVARSYESFIDLPQEIEEKVDIAYEGEEIDNLSTLRFFIFNYTNRNLSNIQLHFEIEDEAQKYTLISSSLSGPENYPKEGVHSNPSKNPNVHIFTIDSLNRSVAGANFTESFVADFIFLGNELPNIKISTSQTGVKLRNGEGTNVMDNMNTYERIRYYVNNNRQAITFFLSTLIAMLTIGLSLLSVDRVARKFVRRSLRQHMKSLANVELSNEQIEHILELSDQLYYKYMFRLDGALEILTAIIKRET